MKTLKIKKLVPEAVIPKYATDGSAGLDLTATKSYTTSIISPNFDGSVNTNAIRYVYETGLAFEIPEGHVGLLFPRSSVFKMSLSLSNCVGIIDADFRGEVKFYFTPTHSSGPRYQVGDRVGQLIIFELPNIQIEEVSELSETVRGVGGFGSSGK